MKHDSDILIVGGGLNGGTLALALAQTGFSITLIEGRAPTVGSGEFDGRSYALALASQRLLKVIGIWEVLDARAQPILDIKVSDGRAGEGPSPFFLHFDHAEIEEGPMGFMVEDRHFRPVLQAMIEASPAITLRSGSSVVAQDTIPGGVRVRLADGTDLTGQLLMGADGRASGVAERAGIARRGWSYHQTALVCAIGHERSHDGVAHQFFMPSGPLAILPLHGNRASIVWTEETQEADRISNLGAEEYLEVLRPRFGDFLGDIHLDGARYHYPLALSLAERFVAPRVALLGDAAHVVHPIAGQGLNAGLRDVASLVEVIVLAARRGEDIGTIDVLQRYEQWRRFDVVGLAAATDTFNRLFSTDNPILRLGRDLGLGVVNALPGLRRGFIREAAGLTGEVPRLLQGRMI
ncbi:UbiH/UbiF/VisC/COQ6 family ubiquinone biosynthesis hydroxylase [Poseidonocella pacifica]|nr:UbiH/UbiF/VisC/COQ6 family ubiquinone biosynthesis hydroxylase [Poseidonocella pacifica]